MIDKTNLLADFFESYYGARFVDADTGEPLYTDTISLCEGCQCMTKTRVKDNTCIKCGAKKGDNCENKRKNEH